MKTLLLALLIIHWGPDMSVKSDPFVRKTYESKHSSDSVKYFDGSVWSLLSVTNFPKQPIEVCISEEKSYVAYCHSAVRRPALPKGLR